MVPSLGDAKGMENHKSSKNNSASSNKIISDKDFTPKHLESSEENINKIIEDLDDSQMSDRDAGSLHLPQPVLPAETTPSDEYIDDRSAEVTAASEEEKDDLNANEVKIGFSDEDDLDRKVSLLRDFWKEVSSDGQNERVGRDDCKRRSDLFYKMLFRTEGVSLENEEAQNLDGVQLGNLGGGFADSSMGMRSVLFDKDEVSLLMVGGRGLRGLGDRICFTFY